MWPWGVIWPKIDIFKSCNFVVSKSKGLENKLFLITKIIQFRLGRYIFFCAFTNFEEGGFPFLGCVEIFRVYGIFFFISYWICLRRVLVYSRVYSLLLCCCPQVFWMLNLNLGQIKTLIWGKVNFFSEFTLWELFQQKMFVSVRLRVGFCSFTLKHKHVFKLVQCGS